MILQNISLFATWLIKSSFWYKSLAHKKTSNKKNKDLTFKMDT